MDGLLSSGWRYKRAIADTLIVSGAGVLHAVIVNPAAAAGTVTLYDNTAESGTVIATLTIGTSAQLFQPVSFVLDARYANGLYVGFDATFNGTVTVIYS